MKKIIFSFIGIFAFLGMLSTSYAISDFSTDSSVLIMPRVNVNGTTYYDNVSLELDFKTGTFKLLNATPAVPPQPDQIIETQTVEKFSLGFQGCFRSGGNEVHCHMKITNTDFDKELFVNISSGLAPLTGNAVYSKLYDDLSNEYNASKIIIANTEINSRSGSAQLIRGIPAIAIFTFENISPKANSLTLFQPAFKADNVRFEGDFRSFGSSFF